MTFTEGNWMPWVALAGWLIALAALIFGAWWALFADRPRGRRRCPRCWYDLTFSPGMTCGECGFSARNESNFARTRPRWTVAIFSILGCTAIGLYGIDSVMTKGWLSYVPTRGLVWMLPVAGSGSDSIFTEFGTRARADKISEGQWLTLLERCAAGNAGARPPSDEWMAKYGEFISFEANRRLRGSDNEALQEKIRDILVTIPPRVDLTSRQDWPADLPPTINVVARDWWPGAIQWRIRTTPDLPDAVPDVHVLRDNAIQQRSFTVQLPPLAPGEHDVDVDVSWERRLSPEEPWVAAGEQQLKLPIVVKPADELVLEPVEDETLDARIRRSFSQGLTQWDSGSMPVRVGARIRPTTVEEFDEIAVAVRVDVLRNGTVGRQLDIWWMGGVGGFDRQYAWEVPMWDDTVLSPPDSADDTWQLRVRGLRELAARIDGATKYWAGDVTVPVNIVNQAGAAPARGWVVDEEASTASRVP